jgi:hypothetical protein
MACVKILDFSHTFDLFSAEVLNSLNKAILRLYNG